MQIKGLSRELITAKSKGTGPAVAASSNNHQNKRPFETEESMEGELATLTDTMINLYGNLRRKEISQ